MAVYPICKECGTRRDKCVDVTAHKRAVRWTADVQFTRTSRRMRATFDTRDFADTQERQWYTDHERGLLSLPKDSSPVSFEEAATEWWTTVAIGQGRIKDPHRSERQRVERWKDHFGKRLLSDLSLSDGEKWVEARLKAGIAVNTINRDLKPLRWILDYAVKKGYIKSNPVRELKSLKGANIRVRWLTEAELGGLVNAALEMEDYSLADVIAVAVNTGFRKGNLERLTARDIDETRVTAQKTKSGNPYDVPVAPDIARVLYRLVKEKPTGPILHTVNLDPRFREAARRAGLYTDKKDAEKVTIHTLRHTFAALYLKRGGDIYKLSKLLGHASIAVTERVYAHICPKEMAAQAPLISTRIPQLEAPQLKVI